MSEHSNGHQPPERYQEEMKLVDRLKVSGWVCGGWVGVGTITMWFYLPQEISALEPEALSARLSLVDESGERLPGFSVHPYEGRKQPGVTQALVHYDGPVDEQFRRVIDTMVELGEEFRQA